MLRTLPEAYRFACLHLLAARYEYYVLGETAVPDAAYDTLEDQVRTLERQSPGLVHPESPTQAPGSDLAADYPHGVIKYHADFTARIIDHAAHAYLVPFIKASSSNAPC